MNTAKKQFTVLDNPEKDINELTKIKEMAVEQLKLASIKGSFLTKEDAEDIKNSIDDFISEKLESYGLTVPKLNIEVKTNSVKVNVVASTVGTTGMDVFHSDYLIHGMQYGLRPEWLGCSFIHRGKQPAFLTVTGLDLSKDVPYVRFLQISNGTKSAVRTKLSESLVEQIGIAIEKYKSAFDI